MTKPHALAAALLFAVAPGFAHGLPPWTPDLVAALVDKVGLAAASRDFAARDDAGWTQITAGIQSGDPAWLALVPRLKPTPNASAAESIPIALSLALQNQPDNVLALLPATYPIRQICADIRIEPTQPQSRDFYRKTIASVAAAKRPTAAACLAHLKTAARRRH